MPPFWNSSALALLFSLGILASSGTLFALEVPELRKLTLDPSELATLTRERILVLLHPPVPFTDPEAHKTRESRFVTVLTQVQAPLTRCTEVVTDFPHYPEFMPQVKRTRVKTPAPQRFQVEYDLKFELPVVNLNLNYTVEHFWVAPENLEFYRTAGDIAHIFGRWEFVPLSSGTTLIAYTVWSDTESMGFLVRTMLDAQPDLRIAIPISSAVVVLQAIKERIEGKKSSPPAPASLPRVPRIPYITQSSLPLATLGRLAREGTILFVHPLQWISMRGAPLDLLFVTGMRLAPTPLTTTMARTVSFERYPEFFDQVRRARTKPISNGWEVEWRLKLGFGIFSVPVDYTLRYEWQGERILRYYRIAGDLEYVFGAWEFVPAPQEEGTFIFYTTASQLGEKAPAILKLGNLIPNRQLVVGSSAASVILEKLVEWLEKQG